MKLTKSAIINELKGNFKIDVDFAGSFVNSIFNVVVQSEGDVNIKKIGIFKLVKLKPKKFKDLASGLIITSTSKEKLAFYPHQSLKKRVKSLYVNTSMDSNVSSFDGEGAVDGISVGKVAKIVGVEAHTIRFWTGEFSEFIKYTTGKGDRKYYSSESVEVFKKINALIHIDGVKIKSIKERGLLKPDREIVKELSVREGFDNTKLVEKLQTLEDKIKLVLLKYSGDS